MTLTLLGKPGCHLCHKMRERLVRILGAEAAIEERDVRDDPEMERRYLLQIPVVLLGDQEVVRHLVSEEELRARLTRFGLL